MSRVSTTKGKKTALRCIGETDIVMLKKKKLHTSLSNPHVGKITNVELFILRSERFELHIRHPNP